MTAKLVAPALAGSGADVYEHTQDIADTTWTVAHNLGHYPAGFSVILLSGESVIPSRDDLDVNTMLLTFGVAAAGVAEVIQESACPRLGDLLDANGYKVTNLPDPLTDQEAATKAYVDARAAGMDPKGGCASVSLANVALTGTQTIQGVALTATQRVLLTAQTAPAENGPWVVASGAWTRPADFAAASTQHPGAYCMIEAGNYAGHGFIMTGTTDVTVGTTAQTWVEFTGAADISVTSPIQKSGNTISLGTVPVANGGTGGTDAATAKTNLGFMSRYAADIGNGSSNPITVTHSLGTLDVNWQVYKKSDGVDEIVSGVRTDANTLTLTFGAVPATNSYRVVVIG